MSLVNIPESPKPAVKEAVFVSAKDLAHGLTTEWNLSSKDLAVKCDLAFKFIYENIGETNAKRNKLKHWLLVRKLKQHRFHLKRMVENIRFITVEVDYLIGQQAQSAGSFKTKIKNKRLFDNTLIECKEITIMLLGIASFICANIEVGSNFKAEKDILAQLLSKAGDTGYYNYVLSSVWQFDFK